MGDKRKKINIIQAYICAMKRYLSLRYHWWDTVIAPCLYTHVFSLYTKKCALKRNIKKKKKLDFRPRHTFPKLFNILLSKFKILYTTSDPLCRVCGALFSLKKRPVSLFLSF